ncbi:MULTISPECIES: hypothetical protein [unclassified Streptomyces]|uniref:hypothetical protein n=1 Tax=unclassified Streptomyces TaxID=2593676 RepID=UPI00081F633D|nr:MULTISPECIES: hypothetical protein [unclassified Streptomyces]MYR29532.1 hypothetical protein [Streptomyces sp. SID4945]SCF46598.1 hypothetical protein GA0115257_118537 [Streptomyces sp. LcepLS]
MRRAGVVLVPACLCFVLSARAEHAWTAVLVLLLAGAARVLAEMLLGSGSWESGFSLAPHDRQGRYQGFHGAGTAVARSAGPLLLTALVRGLGTRGRLALAALFLGAGLATGPAVRHAAARGESRSVPGPAVSAPPAPDTA